jgi:hypothetical protein
MKTVSENRIFQDGMVIFLDYISRQVSKEPSYVPHPIIRALMCAMEGVGRIGNEETVMGLSQEGKPDDIHEPYIVVLQRHTDGIEVKEITNLAVNKRLPTDIMILVFRLQIQLDKTEGDSVDTEEAVRALNRVIPGNRFFMLGDRWKEALVEFDRVRKSGQLHIPPDIPSIKAMIECYDQITKDTPWEDYPNDLRSLIGMSVAKKYCKSGDVVISTPKDAKVQKYKIFEIAVEFLIGKSAEFLNSHDSVP